MVPLVPPEKIELTKKKRNVKKKIDMPYSALPDDCNEGVDRESYYLGPHSQLFHAVTFYGVCQRKARNKNMHPSNPANTLGNNNLNSGISLNIIDKTSQRMENQLLSAATIKSNSAHLILASTSDVLDECELLLR